MIVGVPKEIKESEGRVAMVPSGVHELTRRGHKVLVEAGAGVGAGIHDEEYSEVGAIIVPSAGEVYQAADMIVKVKEPLESEYQYFHPGMILFTYLHLAADLPLVKALRESNTIAIAYETIKDREGNLPLLQPMSEVAGRMSVQVGMQFLESVYGGRGVMLPGVPGVLPGKVVIIGGGTVGINAAKIAIGLGADVTLLDINNERLRYLDDVFKGRLKTLQSTPYNVAQCLHDADLAVSGVLIPGARAPKVVSEDMVKSMPAGSVIVDVAIDQGGSVETIDHTTTHAEPTYVKYGVQHYAVPNIPGIVPRTSTFALTGATLPYIVKIAELGWIKLAQEDEGFSVGLNIIRGQVTNAAVAGSIGTEYTPWDRAA